MRAVRYGTGSFAFDIDERAPEIEVPERVEDLLARADALVGEWRALQAVVPSFDNRVGLVERLASGRAVTVSARQCPALVAVGGGCMVGDLAATLQLSELSALRTVHDLVSSGLTTVRAVRPGAQRRRPVNSG